MDRRRAFSDRGLVPLAGGASRPRAQSPGKVWLVGAGPGDPELLTLKAARILALADVVVHDRLVNAEIIDLAPASARRLYVGKRKSRHVLPQEDVNELLVALAKDGLQVVRLKGGDPFMFGRGGEEVLACRGAGVACEIVPGISAALAAAAAAQAPLTHRGLAQSVTFVTGHGARAASDEGDQGLREPDLDWPSLAKANHTLAVYMGLSTAPLIASRLIGAGRAPTTPVVVVENATLKGQRFITTTLIDLGEATAELTGPAVLLIGETAALADLGQVQDHVALEAAVLASAEPSSQKAAS